MANVRASVHCSSNKRKLLAGYELAVGGGLISFSLEAQLMYLSEHAPGSSTAGEGGQKDQSRHHQVIHQVMKLRCGILEQGIHKQCFWYQRLCIGDQIAPLVFLVEK